MRLHDADGVDFWRPLIWQVDCALQLLPTHRGKLYRGISVRFSEQDYRTGQKVWSHVHAPVVCSRWAPCWGWWIHRAEHLVYAGRGHPPQTTGGSLFWTNDASKMGLLYRVYYCAFWGRFDVLGPFVCGRIRCPSAVRGSLACGLEEGVEERMCHGIAGHKSGVEGPPADPLARDSARSHRVNPRVRVHGVWGAFRAVVWNKFCLSGIDTCVPQRAAHSNLISPQPKDLPPLL